MARKPTPSTPAAGHRDRFGSSLPLAIADLNRAGLRPVRREVHAPGFACSSEFGVVDPGRTAVWPRLDATKPFSGRGETILKQNEHPMPQINKEAIMLQIILNAIYREFLKSGFPALASEE